MNFTPEQQSAIDAKNRELLVSAAAGSGKTAVLVRRILHLIRDEGYSIDRMLVVTYTRAPHVRQRLAAPCRKKRRMFYEKEIAQRPAGSQHDVLPVPRICIRR